MKNTGIYWSLLLLLVIGIAYLYQDTNSYYQSHLTARYNELFKTVQVGDLVVLKNADQSISSFFKIVGNPKEENIFIAYGNLAYKNRFPAKDWVQKAIERPIYFEDTLSSISHTYLKKLHQEVPTFKVYRKQYPTDQIHFLEKLMYSPFTVVFIILFAFLLIWLIDICCIYICSRFEGLSKTYVLFFLGLLVALAISRVQHYGYSNYSNYLESQSSMYIFDFLAFPSMFISRLLEVLPIFFVFHYLKNKYFTQKEFVAQECWKFSILFLGGILFNLIAVQALYLAVPYFSIPGINYYQLDQMGYTYLTKYFTYSWAIIAIANFLNNLRKHVKELSRKEKQLSVSEKKVLSSQSELDALQARVNPHFLYNSLNSLASLATINPLKTEEMALALSDFYKHSTNRQEEHLTTLEAECQLVQTYLDIEKIRFGDRLQYSLQVETAAKNWQIPRFLLQPLVENAIKHGFNRSINKIIISIKATKEMEQLHLRIADSGLPFSKQLTTGYGLRSVKKKLKLLFPNTHEFYFINEPEKQVHIVLKDSANSILTQ